MLCLLKILWSLSDVASLDGMEMLLRWFALVLLCGFKKGSTDTTRPFQRFPDVIFLLSLPLFHQRYHVCMVVGVQIVWQILMVVKYTGLCVCVLSLMSRLHSRNLMMIQCCCGQESLPPPLS